MSLLTLLQYRTGPLGFQCWLPATTGSGSWNDTSLLITYDDTGATYDHPSITYDGEYEFETASTGTLSWTPVTVSTCSGV